MQLRDYQGKAVTEVSQMLASGKRKVVFQLATGGGKTICFSAISSRYVNRDHGKAVLILVNRTELLKQTRKTLYNSFGITAQVIVAGMRHIPPAPVYVGMVESVHRRITQLRNIGLVIIDEAHIGAFNKLHQHFPDQYIIGFTATPVSASKKNPMKDHYQDIVCGADIAELIEMGSLCQNITYAPKDIVDRAELAIKNGEFDDTIMAAEYSKPKHINNTVKAYQKWAAGTKTIIFNCNVSHSKQVHAAFLTAGFDSRHLDGTMSQTERDNILRWFAATPNAILNNVAIATTGFDEPSIETVIMNKATMSMPLWLQCTGRGSRPTPSKSAFTIIDMGGNAITHGDWCDPRDWCELFHNPAKPRSKAAGAAPVKNCPQCDAIIPAQVATCQHCGYVFPEKPPAIEVELHDFVVVTRGINVREVIERHRDKKLYYSFFQIGREIAQAAKKEVRKMSDEYYTFMLHEYYKLGQAWCATNRRYWDIWHEQTAAENLRGELVKQFPRWRPQMQEPETPQHQPVIIQPLAPLPSITSFY